MATPTQQQPSTSSELQLYRVLQRANLLQYYDTFISQGGDDVQQLCEAGEDEFLEIMALVGMASKPLHVRRLQKALQAWVVNPAAFEGNGNARKAFPTHVHSMTGSSSQTIGRATSQSSLSTTTSSTAQHSGTGTDRSSATTNNTTTTTTTTQQQQHQQPQQQQQLQQQQQQDYKVTPPQSSTISTSTPWNSSLLATPGQASPSDHSNREQPSPTDSQEEDFKDLFSSDPSQLYSGSPMSISSLGQSVLLEHQITAIAASAAILAQELPAIEPKSLPKKQISKEINLVMTMSADDPMKMDALRKYAAIYGRFDSKRKNDRPMSLHEISVNEAAAQLCSHLPALLTRREELFPLARQVVRDSGYQYSKGHSRAAEIVTKTEPDLSPDDPLNSTSPLPNGVSIPPRAVSPLEDKVIKTQNDLTDVTSNLSELVKEQERIRSALRVLLEAKDHTQMSALTAEMDTINDRYARLTTRRQELVVQLALLRRQSPKHSLSGASPFGNNPLNIKLNDKHNKYQNGSGAADNNFNLGNGNNNNNGNPSSNSLNTLYMAAALQNAGEGSLIEEGLRIATQYGMSDFAQELIGMKNLQDPDSNNSSGGENRRNSDERMELGLAEKSGRKFSRDQTLSSNSTPSLRSSTSSPIPYSYHNNIVSPHATSTTITTIPVTPIVTTINIVSGMGFQQYTSSATSTTQRLQTLDTLKMSRMSTTVSKDDASNNIHATTGRAKKRSRSPSISSVTPAFISSSASSPDLSNNSNNNNNDNNNDNITDNNEEYMILPIPTVATSLSFSTNKLNDSFISDSGEGCGVQFTSNSSQNTTIGHKSNTSPPHSPPGSSTPPSSSSSPSKPVIVEIENTRRSSRKRNTDPDYYLINGGEKRFRSSSSRRSSSTSSERNAKLISIGTVTPSTSSTSASATTASATIATVSPSSSFSSSSSTSFPSPVSLSQSPSQMKGGNVCIAASVEDMDGIGNAITNTHTVVTDTDAISNLNKNVDGLCSQVVNGAGCADGSVVLEGDNDLSNSNGKSGGGGDSCSSGAIERVDEELGSGAGVGMDESFSEGSERRVGRRKRNQHVVSYTTFR